MTSDGSQSHFSRPSLEDTGRRPWIEAAVYANTGEESHRLFATPALVLNLSGCSSSAPAGHQTTKDRSHGAGEGWGELSNPSAALLSGPPLSSLPISTLRG